MIKGNEPINSIPDLNNHPSSWYGLTKREYFTAMAMQGILANASNAIRNSEFVSGLSVEYADALIKALNETKTQMTPSPKEKAEELILMYLRACDNKDGWFNTSLAKKAAIIAVDEIINSSPTNPLKGSYIELYSDMVDEAIEYYKEVKQELEKL